MEHTKGTGVKWNTQKELESGGTHKRYTETLGKSKIYYDDINILGATTLRLSGKDNEGDERSNRQMVYVTNNT